MALNPINEVHALQIQAGTLGRKSGHAFEDKIVEQINSFRYPHIVPKAGVKHVASGDPAQLLLRYIATQRAGNKIVKAVALSTGALATSEEGRQWLTINGANVKRCKSDLVITVSFDKGAIETVGVSTKQCNNDTPTNAQLYFTTARGFAQLLNSNGIPVTQTALDALRKF